MTRLEQKIMDEIARFPVGNSPWADNIAIVLCTYFSDHPDRPENDVDDEDDCLWGEWVQDQYERVLNDLAKHLALQLEKKP